MEDQSLAALPDAEILMWHGYLSALGFLLILATSLLIVTAIYWLILRERLVGSSATLLQRGPLYLPAPSGSLPSSLGLTFAFAFACGLGRFSAFI